VKNRPAQAHVAVDGGRAAVHDHRQVAGGSDAHGLGVADVLLQPERTTTGFRRCAGPTAARATAAVALGRRKTSTMSKGPVAATAASSEGLRAWPSTSVRLGLIGTHS